MSDRRAARKMLLEILYECEITGINWRDAFRRRESEVNTAAADFCRHLLKGLEKHKKEIDGTIGGYTKNWTFDRLSLIDRNILRLALLEMKYEPSIPMGASINEAIDLAKEYGGIDSGKFVNGVLGQLAVSLEDSSDVSKAKSEGTE